MSENPDPVIGWMLGELRKAGNEGLSAKELSDLLDNSSTPDQNAKNATWKALTSNPDVCFMDETKAPLQNLTLSDVLVVGQGDVRLRLVVPNGQRAVAASNNLVASIESDTAVLVGGGMGNTKDSSDQTKQIAQPSQPVPKRRGRPPKAKKNGATPKSSVDQVQASSATASSAKNPAPSVSRSTSRQSKIGIASSPPPHLEQQPSTNNPIVAPVTRTIRPLSKNGIATDSLPLQWQQSSNNLSNTAKPRNIRRRSQATSIQDQIASQPVTVASEDFASPEQTSSVNPPKSSTSHQTGHRSQEVVGPELTSTRLNTASAHFDTIAVESSEFGPKEPILVSQAEDATASIALGVIHGLHVESPAPTATISASLPAVDNEIELPGESVSDILPAAPPIPIISPPPPTHEPFEIPEQPDRRPTSPLESALEPVESHDLSPAAETAVRRSSSRFSAEELLPEATYYSQADMDWEDGKDGVYINPPGVKVKKPQGFKKKKHSTLVVFRLPQLKDRERLVNGKDTWQQRIMPVVTQARLTSADDAVEQGLVPLLNKKRKAAADVENAPKKVAKKRVLAGGEVDPTLAQEWKKGYPEDHYGTEKSDISILEADVAPEPENANNWSVTWTRETYEDASLDGYQQNVNNDSRASSFTPSDSEKPYGSPSPPGLDETVVSPTAENTAMSSIPRPEPQLVESIFDPTGDDNAIPPSTQIRPTLSTPSKEMEVGIPAMSHSPVETYRSPYAVDSASSPSKVAGNIHLERPINGLSHLQSSPFAPFVPLLTQHDPAPTIPPPRQLEAPNVPDGDTENASLLGLLQSTSKTSSYRSPYAVSTQSPDVEPEHPYIPGNLRTATSAYSQHNRVSHLQVTEPDTSIQSMEVDSRAIAQPELQVATAVTEPSASEPTATPPQGNTGEPYKPSDVSSFLEFMDRDLSLPSGISNRGKLGRGVSSTRASIRGRGARGGTRGGRGGPVRETRILPPPRKVATQQTKPMNQTVPEAFFSHDGPPSQSFDNAPAFDDTAPSLGQSGAVPTTEGGNGDDLAPTGIETSSNQTPNQSADLLTGSKLNPFETSQMTPSRNRARGNRSTKSMSKAPPAPKPSPAPKTPKAKSDLEEKLRLRIAEAEDVQVPDGAINFPCMYKDHVGNLVLSRDQTFLDFFALSQTPPELPMASIKVFNMDGNPIMSAKGSFPMELHLKTKDQRKKRGYRFTYASSESESAQDMRTKIVTAMIASEFTAGEFATVAEAQAAKVRPFQCELCGGRFKNSNGLEYHLEKARTKCNPNWDPAVDTGKRGRKPNKGATAPSTEATIRISRKKSKKTSAARGVVPDEYDLEGFSTSDVEQVPISRSARKITAERLLDSDGEEAPRSARPVRKSKPVEDADLDAEGDSDDSIFDWARDNATSGYAKTRRSTSISEARPPRSAKKAKATIFEDVDADGDSDTSLVEWFEKHGKIDAQAAPPVKTAKIYKALNREAEVADQIVKDFAERIRVGEEEIFGLAIVPSSQLTTANDIATEMTCKDLTGGWYEEVVLNLVRRNEGMFPAEKSVWFASVAIWLKQHPFTTVLPESKFCAKAVDDLVESKTFTKVDFEFKDRNRNPRLITRSILTTNGLDMKTQRADLIKELVQETHPKSYVPSQLAPPPSALDKLQAVVARLLPSLTVIADAHEEEEGDGSPLRDFGDDSDSDDFMENAQDVEVESQGSDIDEHLDDDHDEDSDDPISALPGTTTSKKKGSRTLSGGIIKRRRQAGHNAKISEGVRRRFDEIRAGGENPYPWNFKPNKSKRMTMEERMERAEERRRHQKELAAEKLVCWDPAPAFMPSTDTGAWDQRPSTLQVDWMTGSKTGKNVRHNYARRQHIPEPITYMQAPNGAWSFRPFGHGVNPIYSRPARRAEGSANNYLNRVENGHRPIISPPVKNRVHLPAVPSLRLLQAVQSGQIDEATGLPIPIVRQNGQGKRKAPTLSLGDDDEPAPKRKRRAASVRFAGLESDDDTPGVQISRTTGKPKRAYSRNFPKQVFVSNLADSGAEPKKTARKPKFTEVEILNFYEPKKLAGNAPRNPGLDTVPAQYGLDPPNGDLEPGYSPDHRELIFIASSYIDEDPDPGASSWSVARLDTYRPSDYNFRWDDATLFTVENLPYSDLQEESDWIPGNGPIKYAAKEEAVDLVSDGGIDEPKPKRQRKNPQYSSRQAKKSKDVRDGKYSYVRQHTALAMDFDDVCNDPVVAGNYFGVEIGTPNESTLKRSRNLGSNVMLPEMESRFAVSCMVIRVLAGGLDLQVDWILLAQMFPEYSLNFLKKVWNGILLRKKSAILRLENEFREQYLAAYVAKEIPRIDYNRLTQYPWPDLIDWVMNIIDCSLSNKTIILPPSREEVAENFELRETKEDGCAWRETYFGITAAVYKRSMASASTPNSLPLQPRKRRHSLEEELDKFAIARSWVRVAALTPNEDWDRDLALKKLGSFKKSLLANVLDSLVNQKVIKRRAPNKAKNGRLYEIHDSWSTSLRRHMKESQFTEAVTFKRFIDVQFRSGVQCIKADYFANEGTIMCLTSLQAHGRIRFHGANIPMNKFGLGDGGYESKKIPKERLRFNIDVYPTDSYLYDDANPVLSNIIFRDPPRGGEHGEIPIWYGLTGKPIWLIWHKILSVVGQVVALRAGITVQGLKESFKSLLEEWEWRLLMEWGCEVGVFFRLGEGISEGWSVGEWWWAVIGAGFMDGEGVDGVDGVEGGEGANVMVL